MYESDVGLRCRSLGVQIESCDGDVGLVRKALAAGLLLNAVRLTGTSVGSDRDAGTHEYELLRSSGEHAPRTFKPAPSMRILKGA